MVDQRFRGGWRLTRGWRELPISLSLVTRLEMVDARKRLNLVHEELSEVPIKIVKKYGKDVKELDLSYNYIQDFRFLLDMPNIEMLILDHNQLTAHLKLPDLPNLHTLWANNNNITNLAVFISSLSKSCPSLRFLSMMNNEAAPSYFNGGTYNQYKDYRHYVISQLKKLEVLDDTAVTKQERAEAERIYAQHLPHVPTTFTPDKRTRRRSSKNLSRSISEQNSTNPQYQ